MSEKTTTTDLLNQLMKKEKIKNDCQLAKFLKITPTAIYRYRNGQSMDYKIALKVCRLLKIEAQPVLANITADREINQGVKKAWKDIAKKLETACLLFVLGITVSFQSDNAFAGNVNESNELHHNVYYVKLLESIKKMVNALLKWKYFKVSNFALDIN